MGGSSFPSSSWSSSRSYPRRSPSQIYSTVFVDLTSRVFEAAFAVLGVVMFVRIVIYFVLAALSIYNSHKRSILKLQVQVWLVTVVYALLARRAFVLLRFVHCVVFIDCLYYTWSESNHVKSFAELLIMLTYC